MRCFLFCSQLANEGNKASHSPYKSMCTDQCTPLISVLKQMSFAANTASKQPWRSNLKSDLKFMAQNTYATTFLWTVLVFFWTKWRKEEERQLTSTRPVGFAAGNKNMPVRGH